MPHVHTGPAALGGVALKAIAGIDTALWDIKAKALGVPVYELFGGPYQERSGHTGDTPASTARASPT